MLGVISRCRVLSGGRNNFKFYNNNNLIVTQQLRCSFFTTTSIHRHSKMHPLDDSSVESFFIPGAKVFDRYFDCPLGKY
jgi:hypothetical protein